MSIKTLPFLVGLQQKSTDHFLKTPPWKTVEWTTRYGLCQAMLCKGKQGIFMMQVSLCTPVIGDKWHWVLERAASIAKGSFFVCYIWKSLIKCNTFITVVLASAIAVGGSQSLGVYCELPFWEGFPPLDNKNMSLCWPEQYKPTRHEIFH